MTDDVVVIMVTRITMYGSVAVGIGTDHDGRPASFVGDGRMMRRLSDELADGRHPLASVPTWAVLELGPRPVGTLA